MRIAIVVHGRFHAFDLAKALLARGHDVHLFTNYPGWAVARFGFPSERVQSCIWHGVLVRVLERLRAVTGPHFGEKLVHRSFGRWVARTVDCKHWDIVHSWSGVSKELLDRDNNGNGRIVLLRGSTHIRLQRAILDEEEKRTGRPLEKPSDWMVCREEEEYALAKSIRVISSFALESFTSQGVPRQKLYFITSASPVEGFGVDGGVAGERVRRIASDAPLRVLFAGALSYRKGLHDLLAVGRRLRSSGIVFRFVGSVAAESRNLIPVLRKIGELVPKVPQEKLVDHYAWADLMLFPSLEEGYPQVLAQAAASALPILTTPNAAGADIVEDGVTGWIVPIRAPDAICQRLLWADGHREELVRMVTYLHMHFRPRTWDAVAADFERTFGIGHE